MEAKAKAKAKGKAKATEEKKDIITHTFERMSVYRDGKYEWDYGENREGFVRQYVQIDSYLYYMNGASLTLCPLSQTDEDIKKNDDVRYLTLDELLLLYEHSQTFEVTKKKKSNSSKFANEQK